jgi:hypothetical protein
MLPTSLGAYPGVGPLRSVKGTDDERVAVAHGLAPLRESPAQRPLIRRSAKQLPRKECFDMDILVGGDLAQRFQVLERGKPQLVKALGKGLLCGLAFLTALEGDADGVAWEEKPPFDNVPAPCAACEANQDTEPDGAALPGGASLVLRERSAKVFFGDTWREGQVLDGYFLPRLQLTPDCWEMGLEAANKYQQPGPWIGGRNRVIDEVPGAFQGVTLSFGYPVRPAVQARVGIAPLDVSRGGAPPFTQHSRQVREKRTLG